MAEYDFLTGLRERGYGFSFDVDTPDRKFDKPTLMLLDVREELAQWTETPR